MYDAYSERLWAVRIKRVETEKTFPIWNEVKDKVFPGSNGTFHRVIHAVDRFFNLNGIGIIECVLANGHHQEFFPGTEKKQVESILSNTESTLIILHQWIHLTTDGSPAGGKWLIDEVDKGQFSRLWEFHIVPAIRQVKTLYGGGVNF